ncbi:MAG: AAA family ATPase [Tissierellia bacterium]|nr:AAA family ATPase [Tissierellia bacterium]
MIIKRYIGLTAYEAMNQLKRELGSDAVVLNTRKIRQKGFLGLFKKPMVEITAAYESKKNLVLAPDDGDKIDKVNSELVALKSMVEDISSTIIKNELEISRELQGYYTRLLNNGVDHSIATSILRELDEQIDFSDKDEQVIEDIIKHTIWEYIGQIQPISIDNRMGQKIIFLIGPTGVGKTTTLAKLVAKLAMAKKYRIGLVTSDTYRIAAVEQLKIYSDILGLPLEIIYNSKDFNRTLLKFKDKDFIFVDTAGQNHRKVSKEDELYKMMDTANNKEVYLVLSGTTNLNVLKSILEQYSFIEDYKIIFTKMDEAREFGNMLNLKYLTSNPLSYMTTGQNVPDDINVVDRDDLIEWLIGEDPYERSS